MILCRTVAQLQAALTDVPRPWTLVPTMGGLHAGHLSLIERAREHGPGAVLATLFVNRHQFDEAADFVAYPREEAADVAQFRAAGADLVYAPDEHAVWGDGAPTLKEYEMPGLTDVLEGQYRRGHLVAMAAVVARLFDQAQPDAAVFGEKDYQQLVLVQRLAARRNPAVEIVAAPVVREADGLAMSSRNHRLAPEARVRACVLQKTLQDVARAMMEGGTAALAEGQALDALRAAGLEPDYVAVRDADSLQPVTEAVSGCVVLAAARLAGVRLLDMAWVGSRLLKSGSWN